MDKSDDNVMTIVASKVIYTQLKCMDLSKCVVHTKKFSINY